MESLVDDPRVQEYINYFEAQKDTLPDALSSVKNITITDTASLFKTLLFFFQTQYDKRAILFFPDAFFGEGSFTTAIQSLNPANGIVLNLRNKTRQQREALLPPIFESMMTYLPSLHDLLPKDLSFIEDHKNKKKTDEFLNHLYINKGLLLTGPPYADHHTIDAARATEWVNAQRTPFRRTLAEILLQNIRYIPHSLLLERIQKCVDIAFNKLVNEAPVVFIVGRMKKSNYYISLLFAHFWLEKGYPLHCVMEKFTADNFHFTANFLDIDDMAYSGSQTEKLLESSYKTLVAGLRGMIHERLQKNKEFQKSHMFLPRIVVEKALQNTGFHYILVRIFMTENSVERLSMDPVETPKLPFELVTSEVLPYMPGVPEYRRKMIEHLFNNQVFSTVYFDHKVADMPSTFLLPIALGIVPGKSIIRNANANSRMFAFNNLVEGEEVTFIPFIRHCGPGERLLPPDRAAIFSSDPILADRYRCPSAWYKQIDYDRGEYNPEAAFGGRRRKLQKTRKRNQRQKQTRHR